jgi:hypothetical protein
MDRDRDNDLRRSLAMKMSFADEAIGAVVSLQGALWRAKRLAEAVR